MERIQADVLYEGDVVGGMPVQAVAVHRERNGVKKSVKEANIEILESQHRYRPVLLMLTLTLCWPKVFKCLHQYNCTGWFIDEII